jgi:hypothetical protein
MCHVLGRNVIGPIHNLSASLFLLSCTRIIATHKLAWYCSLYFSCFLAVSHMSTCTRISGLLPKACNVGRRRAPPPRWLCLLFRPSPDSLLTGALSSRRAPYWARPQIIMHTYATAMDAVCTHMLAWYCSLYFICFLAVYIAHVYACTLVVFLGQQGPAC